MIPTSATQGALAVAHPHFRTTLLTHRRAAAAQARGHLLCEGSGSRTWTPVKYAPFRPAQGFFLKVCRALQYRYRSRSDFESSTGLFLSVCRALLQLGLLTLFLETRPLEFGCFWNTCRAFRVNLGLFYWFFLSVCRALFECLQGSFANMSCSWNTCRAFKYMCGSFVGSCWVCAVFFLQLGFLTLFLRHGC